MSHFNVLVISASEPSNESLQAQLQPFHEFECTGTDDQYVQDVDITDKVKEDSDSSECGTLYKSGLEYHGLSDRIVSDESEVDRSDAHKYGYSVVRDGVLIKAVRRTNPNNQWDWWVVGGRWSHLLIDKEDGKSGDCCTLDTLDWDALKAKNVDRRRNAIEKALTELQEEKSVSREDALKIWADYVDAFPQARTDYENLPNRPGRIWDYFDTLPEDHPIRRCVTSGVQEALAGFISPRVPQTERDPMAWIEKVPALQVWAILTPDGKWHEHGKMGWFGMSSDEKEDWDTISENLIKSQPSGCWGTIVDCHI